MTIEGWTAHSRYRHVFAIVRVDEFTREDMEMDQRIRVTKVVVSEDEAIAEVKRLNALQEKGGGGSRYFWQMTRLVPSAEEATEEG
jgi:hypothetical protein